MVHNDMKSTINEGRANTVSVINLILLIVILVLGLTGHFAGQSILSDNDANGLTKADVKSVVEDAIKNAAPVAAPTPAPTPAPQPAPAPSKAELSDVEKFYETAYVNGNKDAKVTIIEFSDFECPFCVRHANNGTLDQVKDKYEGDVNVVFAHFPLSFHPNAQKAGEAVECAGKIGGEEGFFKYKKALFAKGGKPTLDVLETIAGETEFDTTAFMACVNGDEFAQKVKDQMAFGRSLGITGTPGNIVMDNETGDFQKVSGAVPATAFDAAISSYLK